ncbi:complement receptor type 1-like isoform X1 [Mycteria americana]|uniref:complement receptor type 1-like isoform X1 n=1 Tax=Mycteria americana TaxID=33587 RepID=UPI003F588711
MALRWLRTALLALLALLALPGAWGYCGQPPRFAFAEPPTPLEEPYVEGTKLRYKCRPGYKLATGKSPVVTCNNNSVWLADPDFCIGKPCGPPDIMNGRFEYTTDLLFGATVTFSCNVGYRLVGKSTAQCVLQGSEVDWDNIPHCAIIACLPPPVIENGQVMNGDRDFIFGTAVTYSCNKGFTLIGDAMIDCTTHDNLNGIWSGPAPHCKVVKCENPEVKNGKRLSGFGTDHRYKDTVTFECNPGYLMNGSSTVTCEADSMWKPPLPTCDRIFCSPAPHFPFAETEGFALDKFPAGTQLRYRCKPGYAAADGKSSVVTCLSDATWSADPDFCIRRQCTRPTIENGDVIPENFLFEAVVTFSCHPGYELKGSSSAICVVSRNGVDWDTAFPRCEIKRGYCGQPPRFAFAEPPTPLEEPYVEGTKLRYKCRPGYKLAGGKSPVVTCDNNSVWSADPDFCIGKPCGPPDIMNGRFEYTTDLLFGATVTFSCNVGYRLVGKSTAQCVLQGSEVDWDNIPHCAIIACLPPPVIENGQVMNGDRDFIFGTAVTYSCNKGFTLIGDAVIHCTTHDNLNGIWSRSAPDCKSGANMIIVGIFPLLLAMLVMNI